MALSCGEERESERQNWREVPLGCQGDPVERNGGQNVASKRDTEAKGAERDQWKMSEGIPWVGSISEKRASHGY